MKKILFTMLAMVGIIYSAMAQFQFNLSDNWINTTTCSPSTATVSGSASLSFLTSDGGYDPCANSSVTVQLQRLTSFVWNTVTTQTVNTGFGSGNYSFSISSSGQYRIVGIPNGGSCGSAFSTFIKNPVLVTINFAPSASFKIDGITVNNSAYTNVFNCASSNIQMTNILVSGSTSSTANFNWRIVLSKVGGTPASVSTAWSSTTLPANYDIKNLLIIPNWSDVVGEYTVELWVRNSCNTSGFAYNGKIRVSETPRIPHGGYQINTGSGGSCSITSSSSPCTICMSSIPTFSITSSTGIITSYVKELEKRVGSTWVSQNAPQSILVPFGGLSSLNGILAAPNTYVYNATDDYRLKVTLVNTCGSSPAYLHYFKVNGACKVAGGGSSSTVSSVGVDELSIFPNPSSDVLNVQSNSDEAYLKRVMISDMTGKELIVKTIEESTQTLKLEMSLKDLAKGIYVIEVESSNGITKSKIIVER
jgi:hypothetical protein